MQEELNSLNIPAFKRKRSITAKEKQLAVNEYKPKINIYRPSRPPKRSHKREDTLMDIPVKRSLFPEQSIEEDYMEDMEELEENTKQEKDELREMRICGHCEGYFENIEVAIIKVTSPIRKNDKIIFETETGLFEQKISSMQIDRKDVNIAKTGSDIGVKALLKPKVGAYVYKVI
ncbi:MAG: hypothetical protein WC806_04755 [Candidatus Gracilibacteria bacterium]|jgi:hypothetical protein